MAAGATVGSNHNSRAADGEIIAGRGFWPGLCVSLKHNSRFASYTLIVKGDFLHELDVRIPFSLVSNDVQNDRLVIVPGYWFMYNMYALMRNTSKFTARDKRQLKNQYFEYDILAPDTVNEIFDALKEIEQAVSWLGEEALQKFFDKEKTFGHEVLLVGVENSNRKVVLRKPTESYQLFKRLIRYYAATQMLDFVDKTSLEALFEKLQQSHQRKVFVNVGGQLIPEQDVQIILDDVKKSKLNTWTEIHERYHQLSDRYADDKLSHSIACLTELIGIESHGWDRAFIKQLFLEALETKRWIRDEIERTRAKDYNNAFRKMVYSSEEEMNMVVGKLSENSFIKAQTQELSVFEERLQAVLEDL